MFERYTERARRVLFFARYEATQLGIDNQEREAAARKEQEAKREAEREEQRKGQRAGAFELGHEYSTPVVFLSLF